MTDSAPRRHRAKQPRFPIGITSQTFELAYDYIMKISYLGPLGLGFDDTKIREALSPFFDHKVQCYMIVGGCDNPFVVLDPEAFSRQVQYAKVIKAVTRLATGCAPIFRFLLTAHCSARADTPYNRLCSYFPVSTRSALFSARSSVFRTPIFRGFR